MQQVNLYQGSAKHEEARFSAASILKIGGAFAAVLFLLYAQAFGSAWLKAREVSGLEARKAEQEQRLGELKAQARDPAEGKVLESEIVQLTKDVRTRQRLYEVFSPETWGNTQGFSSHLTGLARQRVKGVWLKKIQITEGGQQLALAGSTLSPEGVPGLLEKLSHEPVFAGREFQRFLLQRESAEARTISFSLSSLGKSGS